MNFSPEQLAEVQALIAAIVRREYRLIGDHEDIQQEITLHLLGLDEEYDARPTAYWATTIRNMRSMIRRRDNAAKRGKRRTSQLDLDLPLEDERATFRPEDVDVVLAELPGDLAEFAMLLTTGSLKRARSILGLSRRAAEARKRALAAILSAHADAWKASEQVDRARHRRKS